MYRSKNRFYESREAVSDQFSEMSQLLNELSREMTEAEDVTDRVGKTFRRLLWGEHLKVRQLLVLEHGNGQQEAFVTVSASGKRCVTVREAADSLERGTGRRWQPAGAAKAVVGQKPCALRFVEEPVYQLLHGRRFRWPPQQESHASADRVFHSFRIRCPAERRQ